MHMLNPLNARPQTAAKLDFWTEVYFSQFGPIQDFLHFITALLL